MPDARQPGTPAPEDWGQAFAALPLETPPVGGWNRVAAALPARRSRARVWIRAAAAACLALAVEVPWRDTSPDPSTTTVARAPAATTPTKVPAAPIVSPTPSPSSDPATAVASNRENAPVPAPLADTTAPRAPESSQAAERRRASSVVSRGGQTTDSALAGSNKPTPAPVETAGTPANGSAAALETLYAESARLEALLSQIRDDRVASGPAMALSAALNERVAGIDVALSQPDLSADTRLDLWRERVAALQRLTGVESTQRWMAANGYPADGAVAQVY